MCSNRANDQNVYGANICVCLRRQILFIKLQQHSLSFLGKRLKMCLRAIFMEEERMCGIEGLIPEGGLKTSRGQRDRGCPAALFTNKLKSRTELNPGCDMKTGPRVSKVNKSCCWCEEPKNLSLTPFSRRCQKIYKTNTTKNWII